MPITFNGSFLIYIGWHVLLGLSFITIVGWAWVAVAQSRWICRNIAGTHREILFKATGLEMLWRTVVLRHRLRLHHPDPVDDTLVCAVAGSVDRNVRLGRPAA